MDGPIVIEFWYWWVAAAILAALEIFAPGTMLLWLGLAAGLVGVIVLALPDLDWRLQFLAFAILAVLAVIAYRAWQRRNPTVTDQPQLNRRGEQYVGRVSSLAEAIVNGSGRVRIEDTLWLAEGEDMPAGTRVRVIGAEGTRLRVERAE
jgi:membrane protein implicated in regulation of membrane protease activity